MLIFNNMLIVISIQYLGMLGMAKIKTDVV